MRASPSGRNGPPNGGGSRLHGPSPFGKPAGGSRSLSRRLPPPDPQRREDDRGGRRQQQGDPAKLLRHEVPAGQGLSDDPDQSGPDKSEEHTSELKSLMRNSYAVFCLKKKKQEN